MDDDSDVTMLSSNKVTFTNNLFKTASPSVTITSCSKIIFENNQDDNGNLIFNAASRGSVSNLQASVIQSGNYSNLSFQNIGYCQTAGKFEVVIPLPFMINTGNASYSLNRIVLLGKGTVPTADLSNVTVTFEPTYLRVSNIPWTGATVGSVCIIDVRGDLTFS